MQWFKLQDRALAATGKKVDVPLCMDFCSELASSMVKEKAVVCIVAPLYPLCM